MTIRINGLKGASYAVQGSDVTAKKAQADDVFTEARNKKGIPEEDPQQAKIRAAMDKSMALKAQIVEITPEMSPQEVIATLRANAEIKYQQYQIESEVGLDTAPILLAEYRQCILEIERNKARSDGTLRTKDFNPEYSARIDLLASRIVNSTDDLNELRTNAEIKQLMVDLANEYGDLTKACILNQELIDILNEIRIKEVSEMRSK